MGRQEQLVARTHRKCGLQWGRDVLRHHICMLNANPLKTESSRLCVLYVNVNNDSSWLRKEGRDGMAGSNGQTRCWAAKAAGHSDGSNAHMVNNVMACVLQSEG